MTEEPDECPTCGRVSQDWAKNRAKQKGQYRTDSEDRAFEYRKWRRQFGRHYYVTDIDQVEWRVIDGDPTPVVVLELTRVDGTMPVPQTYLDAILKRFTERDAQGGTIVNFARRLGVDAVIVLFRYDLKEFWLYNLTKGVGWKKAGADVYRRWIEGKHEDKS